MFWFRICTVSPVALSLCLCQLCMYVCVRVCLSCCCLSIHSTTTTTTTSLLLCCPHLCQHRIESFAILSVAVVVVFSSVFFRCSCAHVRVRTRVRVHVCVCVGNISHAALAGQAKHLTVECRLLLLLLPALPAVACAAAVAVAAVALLLGFVAVGRVIISVAGCMARRLHAHCRPGTPTGVSGPSLGRRRRL